jgi:hypothetical protein
MRDRPDKLNSPFSGSKTTDGYNLFPPNLKDSIIINFYDKVKV